MHLVICPKEGREMEAVVQHRAAILAYSCIHYEAQFSRLIMHIGWVTQNEQENKRTNETQSGSNK